MLPDDDVQVKKLRAKQRLLGVALAVIPLTATILYFLFSDRVQDSVGRHLLAGMIVIEWLMLLVIYLSIVSKMRQRRR